ncbi:signal peptidase I [Enterococcus sp. LJL98]
MIVSGGFYFSRLYQIHRISGISMEGMYENNDLVLTKKSKEIDRYSVIAFSNLDKTEMYIKRVIGVPKDRFIINDHRMILNIGSEGSFKMSYSFILSDEVANKMQQVDEISEHMYFVIGDNVDVSKDSRTVGLIHLNQIEGIVKNKINFY